MASLASERLHLSFGKLVPDDEIREVDLFSPKEKEFAASSTLTRPANCLSKPTIPDSHEGGSPPSQYCAYSQYTTINAFTRLHFLTAYPGRFYRVLRQISQKGSQVAWIPGHPSEVSPG